MKQYPEIPVSSGMRFRELPNAYVFDKLDGSNLRFEWDRKRGFHKFGTRSRLFDQTDDVFGEAIPLFERTLADPLERIARRQRIEHMIVFAEFWGPSSFAGLHTPGEPKRLSVIDVAANKRGIMPPADFLDAFGDLDTPRFLGRMNWTRGLIERVRRGELEGVTCEGVVAKAVVGRQLVMAKAKTQVWLERVRERYGETRAREEGL